MEDYAELADEPAAFATYDWHLHHRLTILSGNPIFTLILNGFSELYPPMAERYFQTAAARTSSRAFYAGLLAAALEGDAETAEAITRRVMAASLALVAGKLEKDTDNRAMRRWNGWGDENTHYPFPDSAASYLAERIGPGMPDRADATLEQTLRSVRRRHGCQSTPVCAPRSIERLLHARGQSLPDWVALRSGQDRGLPGWRGLPGRRDAGAGVARLRPAQSVHS